MIVAIVIQPDFAIVLVSMNDSYCIGFQVLISLVGI